MERRRRGVSLVEINIALMLVSVMLLALYAAVVSSIRLSRKDSLYTEATELCQRRIEDVCLTASNRDQFFLLGDVGPTYIGDYNGDDRAFVYTQSVQNVMTNPADFGYERIKKITVCVFQAQPGTRPTPVGAALVQFSTVITAL